MTHYNAEFIQTQEAILHKEKERLEQELAKVATYDEAQGQYIPKFEEFNSGDTEDMDEASEETETLGENTALADNLIKSLTEVKQALADIVADRYGVCDNCGEYIDEERLRVYPAARTCIKCD